MVGFFDSIYIDLYTCFKFTPPSSLEYEMNKVILAVIILYVSLVVVYVHDDGLFSGRSSVIDLWAFAHISFGVFAAGAVKMSGIDVVKVHRHIVCAFLILLGWEVYEMAQEMGLTFHAAIRFHGGVEHPIDRLLIDPIMGLLGILWYRQMPRVFWGVTLAGVAWWTINLYLGRVDGVEHIVRSWF